MAAAMVLSAASACSSAAPAGGRVAAPAGLACPRDRLTLIAGTVVAYQRDAATLHLRLRTDWQSDETLDLHLAGTMQWVHGAPFTAADRRRIETSPTAAVPGLRVRVWLCEDGHTPPVIDWQLPTP